MISHVTKYHVERAIDKASAEDHELLIIAFNKNEPNEGVEVICSMKLPPEQLSIMAREALSVEAEGPNNKSKILLAN
jgi:hypothetical protein